MGLRPPWVGRRVAVWEHVGSTNDLAARASSSRANSGLVVLAEAQSADGAAAAGLGCPAAVVDPVLRVLFPPPELDIPGWLTALGAVAVAGLAEEITGSAARIKWPNDVRVDRRKLAGVLVDARRRRAIVGIGLNANLDPAELPDGLRESVTSLSGLLGRRVDRSEVARDLIARLDALYGEAVDRGPGPLDRAWADRSEHLGRVAVETPGGRFVGRLADLGLIRGAVIVRDDGEILVIPTAEIRGSASRARPRATPLTSFPRGLTLSVDGGSGPVDFPAPPHRDIDRPGHPDRLAARGAQHDSTGPRRRFAGPCRSMLLGEGAWRRGTGDDRLMCVEGPPSPARLHSGGSSHGQARSLRVPGHSRLVRPAGLGLG